MKSKTLIIVVFLIGAMALAITLLKKSASHLTALSNPIHIQFSYAIASLDPDKYDDWETVFIGNHIYPRLLPVEGHSEVPFVAEQLSLTCISPVGESLGPECKRVRLTFAPKAFQDCNQRHIGRDEIKNEFERVLKVKPWILPQLSACKQSGDALCYEAKYVNDQKRRLHQVYFRFGFAQSTTEDAIRGAGPYCLQITEKSGKGIVAGTLEPRLPNLPIISFRVSQEPANQFNVALYGSKSLLRDDRLNVQAHTPMAYYVITNPRFSEFGLPWNDEKTKRTIHDHFVSEEVFFSNPGKMVELAPSGNAIPHSKDLGNPISRVLSFIIPNYLPGCASLANKLNVLWGGPAKAECGDIVDFVYKKVRSPKKDWDGFLVGVSPSDPARGSLELQYFSPDSPESWTYSFPKPETLYYLVGIGQSLVTVDGKTVCGLKPNPLGLGDVFITDFLQCSPGSHK